MADIAPNKQLDIARLEAEFLRHEQADCPVTHRFGPGVYIRELAVKAGTFIIGRVHLGEHLNTLVSGRITVFLDDGTRMEMEGPQTFVAPPGRKMAYVHEDVIWQNIYATGERDIETLEEMLFEPSLQRVKALPDHTEDIEDYLSAISENGFSPDEARRISVNPTDCCDFPYGEYKVMVAPSHIEGHGLFATGNIAAGEAIAPARLNGMRTPAGRFTNHAKVPNAMMVGAGNGDIYLFALRDIKGCAGAELGEEITVNYRLTLCQR